MKLKEDDEKQQSKSAEFREHKIDMLAKAGEIGGIMKFILQNRDREVPENVVLKLRDKFFFFFFCSTFDLNRQVS